MRAEIPLFLGGKKVIVIQEITRRAGLKNLIPDTPPANIVRFAVDCTDRLGVSSTDLKLLELVAASTAQSTRDAYNSDVRHFLAWGGTLPATSLTVARYLADHATDLSAATLARRLVAIGRAHTLKAFPNPTKFDLVRLTMRGIRRTHAVPQRRVAALTKAEILAMASSLGDLLKDMRDRAVLLVGFAGAFRRSELVAIDCKSLRLAAHGLVIVISRSKSDQEGYGREILIRYGRGATCPIKALEAWLSASGITDGPMFRSMQKGDRVGPKRLSPNAVAEIVKRLARATGLDPSRYSGHSLRAGFVTSAAAAGMPTWKIKAQTGHVTDAMVSRYIRDAILLTADFENEIL